MQNYRNYKYLYICTESKQLAIVSAGNKFNNKFFCIRTHWSWLVIVFLCKTRLIISCILVYPFPLKNIDWNFPTDTSTFNVDPITHKTKRLHLRQRGTDCTRLLKNISNSETKSKFSNNYEKFTVNSHMLFRLSLTWIVLERRLGSWK